MSDFAENVDLVSERLGGNVLHANDEFFAPKENLIKTSEPVFIADKYTDRGKWMDGWETRRRRSPGYDWCIVQLGVPGILRGVVVDTSYFKGNYPEHCSIDACAVEGSADFTKLTSETIQWSEVLPKSPLQGDSKNRFEIADPYRYTHLRLKIYPDGGVARLRVYGEVVPDLKGDLAGNVAFDLTAIENGGRVVDSSDKFFGAPQNLLMPGKSTHMGDGWETRRRRGPGHDWVVIRLGTECIVQHIEVDTSHFKGNFPASCSVEVCRVQDQQRPDASCRWQQIVAQNALEADSVRRFTVAHSDPASHLRLNIFPDGGVARLRVFATPTREGRIEAGLRLLNSLPAEAAGAALMNCCGSRNWVEQVIGQRPYSSLPQLFDAAERAAASLSKPDWLEAFSHHPQIGHKVGQTKTAAPQSAEARRWSEQEQASAANAAAKVQSELREANAAYRTLFGYVFIVCAMGKSAEEILWLLKDRMSNNPDDELRIAAEEQRKITRLRLEKMLAP